jgi:hypothetical protein
MKNVIVIFQATEQKTESLALAFGLGAVQAGANIRLRHLNPSPSVALAHAGYGMLRTDDLDWAEGIGIFLENELETELEVLLDAIASTSEGSTKARKVAFLSDTGESAGTIHRLHPVLESAGIPLVTTVHGQDASPEDLTQAGRVFAEMEIRSK